MWPILSVAVEAGVLSAGAYFLFTRARAPNNPTRREAITVNVLCVVAAAIFAQFFDTHGRAPALALVIAALEPVVLAGILLLLRPERPVT